MTQLAGSRIEITHQTGFERWLKLPVGNIRPVGVLEERVRLDGVGILWSAAESLLLLAL